jgi:hypothetical protein
MVNYSAADITLVVILILIAFLDIAVFVKCSTFKAPTSLFISLCLFIDLLLRIVELLINSKDVTLKSRKNQKLFDLEHDFT